MAFPQIYIFFKTLTISIKLIFKNGISIASIDLLSLLLSSITIFLFISCYKLIRSIISTSAAISSLLLILFFALSLTFMISYLLIIQASGLAAAIAAARSYTDTRILSLHDLFSLAKAKWRNPFNYNNRHQEIRKPMQLVWMMEIVMTVPIAMLHPNPVTITIASVVVVSLFIFAVGSAVVTGVVGDGDAVERVFQGRRVEGLMLNLLFNVVLVMMLLCFWFSVGYEEEGRFNLMVCALFFVNYVSMASMFWNVVYTVYYFQCVEYDHSIDTTQQFENFHYTTLAA